MSSISRWLPATVLLLAATPAGASADIDVEQSAVARAAASVVQIQTSGSVGTGFVIGGGQVVTAAHVVDGVAAVVTGDGSRLPATVISSEPDIDLALLMVEGLPDHRPLELAVGLPELASDVYALTAPSGQSGVTVSRGIVSGIVRANGQQVIQTDAAVNPGSSGGPVITADGQVIGVTSSKLDGSEGVAFLVPADEVATLTRSAATTVPPAPTPGAPPPEPAATPPVATAWDPVPLGIAALIGVAVAATTITTRRRRRSPTASPFHLDIQLGPERITATPERDRK